MKEVPGLSAEQLAGRKHSLGGSDIGAMLGLSKWKSPVDLWMEKTGRTTPEDIGHRPEVHFGNVLECIVAEEFTRRTEIELEEDRDENGKSIIHRHPKYDFMVGNIDRRVPGDDTAGFEAKTASAWVQQVWGESQESLDEPRDDVPLYYLTQVVHYMEVLGKQKWYLAVLIGGNDFRWYTIKRDEELINEMLRREHEFWAHVQHDTPPEVTSLADVVTLYPRKKRKAIQANDQCLKWLADLAAAQDAEKKWGVHTKAYKTKIADYMTDHALLVDSSGAKIATFAGHDRTTVQSKELKKDMPEIYDRYSKTTHVRPFRLA